MIGSTAKMGATSSTEIMEMTCSMAVETTLVTTCSVDWDAMSIGATGCGNRDLTAGASLTGASMKTTLVPINTSR